MVVGRWAPDGALGVHGGGVPLGAIRVRVRGHARVDHERALHARGHDVPDGLGLLPDESDGGDAVPVCGADGIGGVKWVYFRRRFWNTWL